MLLVTPHASKELNSITSFHEIRRNFKEVGIDGPLHGVSLSYPTHSLDVSQRVT